MNLLVFTMELDDAHPIILGTVEVPECFAPTAAMIQDADALGILVDVVDSDDLPLLAHQPFMQSQGHAILDALRARRANFN